MSIIFTTKDMQRVSINCTEKVERHTDFFKYKVLSIEDNIVKFIILNSPRCTGDLGYALISITHNNATYNICTSQIPELYERTLYVHGSDTRQDSVILEAPTEIFNIYQLGMFEWNISIMKHKTKLLYNICVICNSFEEHKIGTTKIKTLFSLGTHTCSSCVIPEFTDVLLLRDDQSYSIDRTTNFVTASVPVWSQLNYIIKGLRNKANSPRTLVTHIFNTIDILQFDKYRVQNICAHCATPNQVEPWYTVNHIFNNDSSALFPLCASCVQDIHECVFCGGQTRSTDVWHTGVVCNGCTCMDKCYICSIDNPNTLAVRTLRLNIDTRSGSSRSLCKAHFSQVSQHGWSVAKLKPELGYSWKVDAKNLEVLGVNIQKEIESKIAIDVIPHTPVCALEWEFPFNSDVLGTQNRDRAIYLFDEVQQQQGYPDLFRAKHDGSLPQFATEFVSDKPKSLKMWHKLYFDGVLRQLAKFIDVDYIKAHPANVGGHIHISRGSFTPTQVGKVIKFLYSNIEFLNFICNRKISSGYYSPTTGVNPLSFAYNKNTVSPEKYTLARVTHNMYNNVDMGTIEVRAFRAPISDVEVIQNIEFMFALRSFVKYVSGKDINRSDAFISHVNENIKLFPMLHEKILSRTTKSFSINSPSTLSLSSVSRPQRRIYTPNTSTCAECDRNTYGIFNIIQPNRVVCTSCSFVCNACREVHLLNESVTMSSEMLWCINCADESSRMCACCDGRFHRDVVNYIRYNGIDDECICDSCIDTEYDFCDDCDISFQRGTSCDC